MTASGPNTKPTKTEVRAQRMRTERPGSFGGYSVIIFKSILLQESKIYSFLLLSGILLLLHSPAGVVGEIKKAGQEKDPSITIGEQRAQLIIE